MPWAAPIGTGQGPRNPRALRELRERADDLIERGKDVASRKRESITAAVEAGREAFLRESKS